MEPCPRTPSDHPDASIAVPRAGWPALVGVDEGLDRLFRWEPATDAMCWSHPLATKCRTLQRISTTRLLGVQDRGWFEADLANGGVVCECSVEASGVIAASRGENGCTFLTGLDLSGLAGVCFAEYDLELCRRRAVCFHGDYVRGATLTAADTILFTNNDCVVEGDWSGRILRQFAAPGFKHAWKAIRLDNDHTLISAGYGAFIVEFDPVGREVHRWECGNAAPAIRPHFFGDFARQDDGSLIVCNWLGHGAGLGGTGCALLHFDSAGMVVKTWQEPTRTSSVQAFILLPGG